MKFVRHILSALAVLFLTASFSPAWEITRVGWHAAPVWSAVRITLGYGVTPTESIDSIRVKIDGQEVEQPELAQPKETIIAKCGHGETTFIYRPEKRGTHRIEIVPIHWNGRKGFPRVYTIFAF